VAGGCSFLLSAFPISAFPTAGCRPWSFADDFGKTNLLAALKPQPVMSLSGICCLTTDY
jgi:hypothetical protein